MGEVIATSSALTLMWAILAMAMVWGLLRLFDRVSGFDPKETLRGIRNHEMAAAVYLGMRFLGACLLVGLVLS